MFPVAVDIPVTRSTPVLFVEPIPSFGDTGQSMALYRAGVLSHYTYAYTTATTQHRFKILADKWEDETINLSSTSMMCSNKSYQQIIGMGEKALPYIFERMVIKPNHWYWALSAISGVDPVPEQYKGNIKATLALWLDWGKKNGYFYS